ncbi:hypothetical protein OK074_7913 [Actinobacteria bacterium OK074]|nr:hypothetical protein OK074_7913 [Actinobacteria bacterium OK074]
MEPELRTDTERPVDFPESDRDSRPDTERRDRAEAEDREVADGADDGTAGVDDGTAGAASPDGPAARRSRVTPVDDAPTAPLADTTGASPHVSQYNSPPPTSS